MSRPRIDSLKIGQEVTLEVHRSSSNEGYSMRAVFGGIMGIGDERQANFDGFSLYRYNGHWAIASDARRVTVVSVRNPR